jgi:hypothetical protein
MADKIILFNLNTYVGGGETLLVRYAEYLHSNNIDYAILCAHKDSWIESSALSKGLKIIKWPVMDDSLIYNKNLVSLARERLKIEFNSTKVFKLFTFCLRDYVNAVLLFRESPSNIELFHGVYHPQDYEYLSSLSFNKLFYHKYFKAVIYQLFINQSVLFMNLHGATEVLGPEVKTADVILRPIPITLNEYQDQVKKIEPERKIICVSRFAAFKIGAVVAFLRFARQRKDVRCTLVGHGSFEWLVRCLIKLWSIKNITVYNDVAPHELYAMVIENDIGYAQGTSILEIAKFGIPVIIAPYSRLKDIFNPKFSTYGIFGFVQKQFEFGDLVYFKGAPSVSLESAFNNIFFDYERFRDGTLIAVKRFESKSIFKKITQDISLGSISLRKTPKITIKPPIIKQVMSDIKKLYIKITLPNR